MQFFGFCARVPPGGTCRRIMETQKNTHRRFCRWRDKGIWEKLLENLIDDADFEWLMGDATHIKVHPHAAGAKGGNQEMGATKGGRTPKLHLAKGPFLMRMVCRSECLFRAGSRR
jgi:hypothetical protein